ncbi:glycosyl hydrolase family 26 [Vibrio cholerae]|nr:glycosyl hydrolase family 26 [Vibrio cholerae]
MPIREQVSTVDVKIENEGQKPEVIYSANIRSNTIFCVGKVNNVQMLSNLKTRSGTFSSGFNPTAYLQPGENTLDMSVAPIGVYDDDLTYRTDDQCEMTLYGASPDGSKEEISSLITTIVDAKPTIKESKHYPPHHQTPLLNVEGETIGYTQAFSRPIYIKTIPRWRWVDATPIREDNPEQMKQLYRVYNNLIELMEKRDFEGLKMAYSLSMREHAKADGYFSKPEDYYDMVGFEEKFNQWEDAEVEPRRDWSEYSLKSYMGGRLVRLEDTRSHSPLRIGSNKSNKIVSILPYFSMIDGRIVISR